MCEFLCRLDTEDEYTYVVIPECKGGSPGAFCIAFWIEKMRMDTGVTVTPATFNSFLASNDPCTVVWNRELKGITMLSFPFQIGLEKRTVKKPGPFNTETRVNETVFIARPHGEGTMKPLPSLLKE